MLGVRIDRARSVALHVYLIPQLGLGMGRGLDGSQAQWNARFLEILPVTLHLDVGRVQRRPE